MNILGVDVGFKGGLAVVNLEGWRVWPMPIIKGKKTTLDMPQVADIIKRVQPTLVVIEKVHAMPTQGVSSTFKFGEQFGFMQGVLTSLHIPFILVTPQAWKKKVLEGYDWKGDGKVAATMYVQKRYPDVCLLETPRCRKPHDGIVDAICIAEYGRINNNGTATTQE